ncbi:MAG: hypothetical protein FWB78_12040 [Treponema sp.]|nr:hypothetical protein [Treponema sp.]
MARARTQSAENFWREYEETTGEKVLAHGMGQYVSGWQGFGVPNRRKPIWGLVIATSGGFRFHHFPQTGGLLGNFGTSGIVPKEKTIFIPRDRIVAAVLHKETKWYKRLLSPDSPFLRISYLDESSGGERELRFSTVHRSGGNESDIAMLLTQSGQ